MVPDLTNIHLFADTHTVEVMSFSVILGVSIDHADIRRFDDEIENVKEVFPSITSPNMIQIAIGPSEQNPPPPPVPVKDLNLYSPDGKPEWAGSYGNKTLRAC